MKLEDIKKVTVAGAGTQGSQIASQIAYKGFEVTIWVRSEASVERGKGRIATIQDQYYATLEAMKTDPNAYCRGLSDKQDLSVEEIDGLIANAKANFAAVKFETDLAKAFGEADVVVECINENPQDKIDFYTMIAPYMPEKTILLTDSSTMLPSTFAKYTGRADKYMTMHFANQIWKNNLVELMKQDETDQEIFEVTAQFAEKMGMIPLKLNKEQPGYILNSLLIPWFKAAVSLVGDGVCDAETVDKCWVLATGADPGQAPFRKLDKIGLRLACGIISMDPASKNPDAPLGKAVEMLKKYIAEGKTGIAAGEGFYKYDNYDK